MKTGFLIGFFDFCVRGVLGMGVIYFLNIALVSQGVLTQVGMNVLTFCTSGILGIPGVILLYGIQFFQML